MQIGMKHRTNIKFKLPIQDTQAKAGHTTSHDFEPIIIEEVFYHGRVAEIDFRNSIKLITPQLIFDRARMMQASKSSSKANSFLSLGQSTQMAGYPKLTPNNKVMIKGNDASHSAILSKGRTKKEGSDDHVDTDESCDFFSDNLSETAAGAVPENQA